MGVVLAPRPESMKTFLLLETAYLFGLFVLTMSVETVSLWVLHLEARFFATEKHRLHGRIMFLVVLCGVFELQHFQALDTTRLPEPTV